jgi:hypothetical protein
MGLSFGFGFGPFRASTRLGGRGGRGGQGNDGGDEEFWLFLFIVLGLASGVPLALSDVWGLATDLLLWGWLFLGGLPSCAILLLHAHRLSVVSSGRLRFNSVPTMLLSLPAGGYSFIVLFALDNQTGARWLLFLSLIPYGFFHLLWVRWTIWLFSQKRFDEKIQRLKDEMALRDFSEKMSREGIKTVDELRVRLRLEKEDKARHEKVAAKRKTKETRLEKELAGKSIPSRIARREADAVLDQLDKNVRRYVEASIKGNTYLEYDFSKEIPRAALEDLHSELVSVISGTRNSLQQIESLEPEILEKYLQIVENVEQYVFEETPISEILMERKQLQAAERQTQQAYLGIAVSEHAATVLNLMNSQKEIELIEPELRRLFGLMRTLLADFFSRWGMRAETKEIEVASLAELVFKQTGVKDL